MKYLAQADRSALTAIVGPQYALFGNDISEDYAHDELEGVRCMPEALLKATSAQMVAAVLAYCNTRCIPVIARGSGTGLVGGAVAVSGGVMLDLTLMNRICALDERNMTVTVEPGVLLMELATFVEDHGFLYPPDPGAKTATIGGNISTNAGGMRAVKYGVTRDYVLSLTVALADGTIETFGAATVKNSSGYSLKDLIVGSEGTLGIIVEATLRLVPKPNACASMLVGFDSFSNAIAAVPKLISSRTEPTAVEFFSRRAIELTEEYLGRAFPRFSGDSALLLTFDGGDEESVAMRMECAAELCLAESAIDCYYVDTEERRTTVWKTRGAFLEAIKASAGQLDEGDVVVPCASITNFVERLDSISEESGLRVEYFGHAGDGNLHVYFCRDALSEEKWKTGLTVGFEALYDCASALGGMVSGEHGIGYVKREALHKRIGDRQIALMRQIKRVFDPNGILNPYKICMEEELKDCGKQYHIN